MVGLCRPNLPHFTSPNCHLPKKLYLLEKAANLQNLPKTASRPRKAPIFRFTVVSSNESSPSNNQRCRAQMPTVEFSCLAKSRALV
jgi:hypothetical protein